jgi:hypothetical protein
MWISLVGWLTIACQVVELSSKEFDICKNEGWSFFKTLCSMVHFFTRVECLGTHIEMNECLS